MKKIFIGLLLCVSILSGCAKDNADDVIQSDVGIRYEFNDVESNEGEISTNTAVVIVSSNLTPESEYDIMTQKLIYRVEKRDIIENTECYIILFGPEENGEFKESKRYAVDVYGSCIFEMQDDGWKKYE